MPRHSSTSRRASWQASFLIVSILGIAATGGSSIASSTSSGSSSNSPAASAKGFKAQRGAGKTRDQLIAAAFAHAAKNQTAKNSASAFPKVPTKPLPVCTSHSSEPTWPQVWQPGTTDQPCYSQYALGDKYSMAGSAANQTVMPNTRLNFSIASPYPPQLNVGSWLLWFNNLFDYQPLMRGSNGVPANDITGYDQLFQIPPSIDDSGCYNTAGGYLDGRFVPTCTLKFGKGPYYGTPAGQTIPYTVFVGSSFAQKEDYYSPRVTNDTGSAVWASWTEFTEKPEFLEPSPYANFSTGVNGGTVQFTDTTLSDLEVTAINWDFGDGKTAANEVNPVHNYAHAGTYTASITVRTKDGQTDTHSSQVTVTPAFNLSGKVRDLSNNGVATTLRLTNTDTSSAQQINVGKDGTYSVAVDNANYSLATDSSAPAGTFAPISKAFAINNADKVVNFTMNTRQIKVTVKDNVEQPVSNISLPITGSGNIFGSLTTDGTGVATVEVTNGTYTLTPTDPHPGQGFTFAPPNASATVNNADAAKTFHYKAAVYVTAVTPNAGAVKGGDTITITGGGFKQGGSPSVAAVTFAKDLKHSVAGTNINVLSDTSLTITTPKGSSLLGDNDTSVATDVQVTSGAYTSQANDNDTFAFGDVPVVTSVTKIQGPITGKNKVVVKGQHFTGATGVTIVPYNPIGTLKVKDFTVDSDTQITIKTLPGYDYTQIQGGQITDMQVKTPNGTNPKGFDDRYTYQPLHVVQLGDSIAAGEGINYNFVYDSSTGKWFKGVVDPVWDGPNQECHQSVQAADHQINNNVHGILTTFACTGATYLSGVEGDQASTGNPAQFGNWPGGDNVNNDYDSAAPDVVLISMGADDIKFADFIADCIANYKEYQVNPTTPLRCVDGNPGKTVHDDFFANLPDLGTHLAQLVHDIEARGEASDSGIVPKIVVQDYYDPFPLTFDVRCPDTTMLDPAQVKYMSELVDKLDTKIASTIRGLAKTDKNVAFAELQGAIFGHQWCDPNPYAYGLSIVTSNLDINNQAPFHPTPNGQQVIASVVTPKVQGLLAAK